MTETPYTLGPASYAKGKMVVQPRDNRGDYKGRTACLCEALGGRWVGRSHGYTLSPAAAVKFERLYAAGFDARVRLFRDSPCLFYREGRPDRTLREALAECGA